MKRLIVLASVVFAIAAGPSAAHAYPDGGCSAPQNWPADAAQTYQRMCGVSLSDALASHSTTAKASGSSSSDAIPVAAGVSGAILGAAFILRQRRATQGR